MIEEKIKKVLQDIMQKEEELNFLRGKFEAYKEMREENEQRNKHSGQKK